MRATDANETARKAFENFMISAGLEMNAKEIDDFAFTRPGVNHRGSRTL